MHCQICNMECKESELTYLSLFVEGSEGIHVCRPCKIMITEYVRGLRSLSARVKMAAFRSKTQHITISTSPNIPSVKPNITVYSEE